MLGILINSFGIAFITKAALGTSPISSLPYVLSKKFPLTLGQFTSMIGHMIMCSLIYGQNFGAGCSGNKNENVYKKAELSVNRGGLLFFLTFKNSGNII